MSSKKQPIFKVGDFVEKFTGDYQIFGRVVGVIKTTAGKTRCVVEHHPGFLHIYNPAQLKSAPGWRDLDRIGGFAEACGITREKHIGKKTKKRSDLK